MYDDALGLVDECVDREHPLVIRRQLAQQVYKLIQQGVSPTLIHEALREWDMRPDAGPPMLPYLVSSIIRTRRLQQKQAEGMKAYADWEEKLKEEMGQ